MQTHDAPQPNLQGKTYAQRLGQRVRYFRRMRLWSQASLAASANLTQATVAQIENGHANPTLHTLEQLATALDIHLIEFLT